MNVNRLEKVLYQLHIDSLEIESSALISKDGLTLVSQLNKGVNEDHIGAMSAALLSVGNRMIENLTHSSTNSIMIQSHAGYVIVTAVTDELLLTVMARPDSKLGMVFHDIKAAANSARTIVEDIGL